MKNVPIFFSAKASQNNGTSATTTAKLNQPSNTDTTVMTRTTRTAVAAATIVEQDIDAKTDETSMMKNSNNETFSTDCMSIT